MRINENTDVNAFYLFPTRYRLKLASNIWGESSSNEILEAQQR